MRRHRVCIDGTVFPRWLIRSFDNPVRRLLHPPEGILAAAEAAGLAVCGEPRIAISRAVLLRPA